MNKLISKIVGVALGLTLATGVGAGVLLGNNNISKADAAVTWTQITSTSQFVDGAVVLITESNYYLDASQTATGNTPRLGNLTLANGLPSGLTAENCLTVSAVSGGFKLISPLNANHYLYSNNSNNGARIGSSSTTGSVWNIEAGSGTNTFRLYSDSNTRYLSRYQTTDFRTYTGNTDSSTAFKQLKLFLCSSSGGYSVTYNSNGATSGTVPTDNTEYVSGASVTVLGNTGNLAKTGFDFGGWNTKANGSGTTYTSGQTFNISDNTNLYAKWSEKSAGSSSFSWDLTTASYDSATADEVAWSNNYASMSLAKGTSQSAANNYIPATQSSTRMYAGHELTISGKAGVDVYKVKFTATTEGYASGFLGSTWTNASVALDGSTVIIMALDETSAISATVGATCGFSSVEVFYTATAVTTYDVTYTAGTNGTGSYVHSAQVAGNYTLLSFVDLTGVSASSGYIFKNYTVGGVDKDPGDSITLSANTAVTVNFEEKPVVLGDVITVDKTDATSTTYVLTTGIAGETAVYSSQNAKATANNGGGLQYRSNNSNSGIVSTTSGGLIKKVTIVYPEGQSGQLDVYCSNTAYTNPTNLYSDSTKGTLVGSITNNTNNSVTITDDYQYVGVRSSSGSRYITSITFEWEEYDPTAPTISIDQAGSEQEIGNSGTLTATVQNGGDNVVTWSTSDSSVISINSSTGAWVAKGIGAATLTATLGSTGKQSSILMTVTGTVSVAEARAIIATLGGQTSKFKVTVTGYVTSVSGTGASSANNSIYIADTVGGSDRIQIYFGYKAVSNWASVSVVDGKISAKGFLTLYNTTYEMTEPENLQAIDSDKAAVQDFVRDYMHMNDYDPSLDNSQGTGACNGASGYYMTAKGALTGLTETQISLFQNDSEFANAKARYLAWAVAYGDTTPFATTVGAARMLNGIDNSAALIIVVITAFVGVTFIGGYFLLRKKKEN